MNAVDADLLLRNTCCGWNNMPNLFRKAFRVVENDNSRCIRILIIHLLLYKYWQMIYSFWIEHSWLMLGDVKGTEKNRLEQLLISYAVNRGFCILWIYSIFVNFFYILWLVTFSFFMLSIGYLWIRGQSLAYIKFM